MIDYGNVITLIFAHETKVFCLSAQKVEGLNYLFDLLQTFCQEQSDGSWTEDFEINICRHGVKRLNCWASTLIFKNWVKEIFSALQDK